MDVCGKITLVCLAVILAAVPSAWARKCYVCDSVMNPGCADANQISQNYQDCSQGGGLYGGSFSGQQQFPQQGVQQFGQPNQYPQQLGQQGNFGGVGGYGGVGGDRCVKIMTVTGQGQPRVQRACGNAGVQGDGCYWQGAQQYCSCNWNYCNGSSRLSTTSAFFFAGVATVLSLLFRSSL
ncbi:hypothetical protein BV898_12826 [Hypsibius exemplaris]|uniref:Protein sleepless n=1 Tax=Hypsibius exemplaris TaxID=2072580 RepID=A0A1W0WCG3_HYPEX|nr:hypothetical protein BV898_12826 [Hypsibius exemplaris]